MKQLQPEANQNQDDAQNNFHQGQQELNLDNQSNKRVSIRMRQNIKIYNIKRQTLPQSLANKIKNLYINNNNQSLEQIFIELFLYTGGTLDEPKEKNYYEDVSPNSRKTNTQINRTYKLEMADDYIIIVKKVNSSITVQLKISLCMYTYCELNCDFEKEMQASALFLTCDDITYQVQTQELQHMNQFKMKIIAGISHKLKTPLNCSLNMLQLLTEDKQLPISIQQKFIIPALSNQMLLRSFINDICDFGQLEQGNFTMDINTFNLDQIICECMFLFDQQTKNKNIKFIKQYSKNVPQEINSDQERLRQVLINLINNAVKWTDHGQISIIVTYIEEERNVEIQITDTGVGMNNEAKDSLFKVWNASLKENASSDYNYTRGIGLGLTITSRLVKGLSNNKQLEFQSVINQGTTFSFYIKNFERKIKNTVLIKDQQSINIQQIIPLSDKKSQNVQQDSFWACISKFSNQSSFFNSEEDNRQQSQKANQTPQRSIYHTETCNIASEDSEYQFKTPQQTKFSYFVNYFSNMDALNNQVSNYNGKMHLIDNPVKSKYANQNKQFSLENSQSNLIKTEIDCNMQNNINQQEQNSQIIVEENTQLENIFIASSVLLKNITCCQNCAQILIVDDEMFNQYVLENILKQMKIKCDKAKNGQEAIDMVQSRAKLQNQICCNQYQIIFMDIDMPIKNGYQSTIEIKNIIQKYPGIKTIICACSAYKGEEDKKKAKECGMAYFLEKPIEIKKLEPFLKKYYNF